MSAILMTLWKPSNLYKHWNKISQNDIRTHKLQKTTKLVQTYRYFHRVKTEIAFKQLDK